MDDLVKKFTEEGGTHQSQVGEFAPVKKSKLETVTTVVMIASVGGKHDPEGKNRWELVAGESYQVSEELADKLIINGWAMGELSRKYSPDEMLEMKSQVQNIGASL